MKERLSKLLTIKSIVTLLLTLVFCYLSVTGIIPAELFMTVFTVVVAFYFGTQSEKKNKPEGIVLEGIEVVDQVEAKTE
jgi:hypothetical protein